MKEILVTGANGQLGKCIRDASPNFPDIQFTFASKKALDIENHELVRKYFQENHFDYCINAAAYTNVEKAESEPERAYAINAEAVKNLASICQANNVVLVHISTDYVFDGKKKTPYVETDKVNPLNVYGASKLKGEEYIQNNCEKFFIFRTSWLYSQYGHNFLKTILKYAEDGKPLTITTEQTGTPTNANDLAYAILKIIDNNVEDYGIYHFSNGGETTWFGFAEEILRETGKLEDAKLAKTNHYSTFAARPQYSVLENKKRLNNLFHTYLDWKSSLRNLIGSQQKI